MRPKTITEEIFDEGVVQGRDELARSFIGLGWLTDEQIAIAMKQPPEYVAKLRVELEATQN